MNISELKQYEDKIAVLTLSDGEITKAKILFVDSEYEDIVVDVISTNRPETYRRSDSSYIVRVVDLLFVEESTAM
jgi:hypothetical protein